MGSSQLYRRELDRLERNRYATRLGFVVEGCSEGSADVLLPSRREILNRGGMVHGGAIASGAICSGMLAAASTDAAADACVRPLSITLSFLAPVREHAITFAARTKARGRSSVHVAVDATAGIDAVASALAVYRIESSQPGNPTTFAAPARTGVVEGVAPVRMSGSPYGSDAGIEVLSEIGSEARLRMPVENNADADGRADPGAIVGLVDNCGAFATYSYPGVSLEQSGATIAMSITFGPPACGALHAVGRVVARMGSTFSSEIEVVTEGGNEIAALATVLYRLRRPRRDEDDV